MSLRKLRAGRVPTANAATWVGDYGTIFYNEATGALRISDGTTPGGNPLTLIASDFQFTFGDFVATTPADGSASLSSVNINQDINIYSNGTGAVNVIGEFNVFNPDGDIYSRNSIFRVSNDGQVRMLVPDADAIAGAIEIIGGLDGIYQPPVNTGVMLHITGIAGTPGIPSRIYNDAQGAYSGWVARRYNGTAASPTKVLANDEIARFVANAYTGGGWKATGAGRLSIYANENQENTAQGGRLEMWACPNGSTTQNKIIVVDVANGITAAAGYFRYDIATGNSTVTQSAGAAKNIGVTCNGRTGQITTNNASIAKGSSVTFTVTNSFVTAVTDTVILNIQSGATVDSYAITVSRVQVGSFNITITNNGSGPLTDTIIFNFAILKVS
jgi:hypothetical protein